MNDDMPWVIGLTDEEVQKLRNKKYELTEYAKAKLKQLKSMDSIRAGDTVKFLGCSKEQITWGNNDDPNPHLFVGDKYYVEHTYIHSQHTKIELRGVKGKFNSVCFEVVYDTRRNA